MNFQNCMEIYYSFRNIAQILWKKVPLNRIFKPHSSASFWDVCLGMGGSSSTQHIYKHWIFDALWPHAKSVNHDSRLDRQAAPGRAFEFSHLANHVRGTCEERVGRLMSVIGSRKRQSLGTLEDLTRLWTRGPANIPYRHTLHYSIQYAIHYMLDYTMLF